MTDLTALSATLTALGQRAARDNRSALRAARRAAVRGNDVPTKTAHFWRPATSGNATVDSTSEWVCLTQGDEVERDRQQALGKRVGVYIRADAIKDSTKPGGLWLNNAAYKAGDWTDISTNHADWFLLSGSNRVQAKTSGDAGETEFYLMDPANAGWQAYLASRINEIVATGWDFVVLDNVELSLLKREQSGVTLSKYATDAAYQAAWVSLLTALRGRVTAPVHANLISQRSPDAAAIATYRAQLDGCLYEAVVLDWNGAHYADNGWTWDRHLALAEAGTAAGKATVLVAWDDAYDAAKAGFVAASYALVSSPLVTYRYSSPGDYASMWALPERVALSALGKPLGARSKSGNSWSRQFEHGTVTVDPVAGTYSITTTTSGSGSTSTPTITPSDIAAALGI